MGASLETMVTPQLPANPINILFIGPIGVGKSSTIESIARLLGGQYNGINPSTARTTRSHTQSIIRYQFFHGRVNLFDCPGLELIDAERRPIKLLKVICEGIDFPPTNATRVLDEEGEIVKSLPMNRANAIHRMILVVDAKRTAPEATHANWFHTGVWNEDRRWEILFKAQPCLHHLLFVYPLIISLSN